MNRPRAAPAPTDRRAPPPAPAPAGTSAASAGTSGDLVITKGKVRGRGQRILLYGDAGAGKSTLASLLPNSLFLDLDRGTEELNTARLDGLMSYGDVRGALANPAIDAFGTLILDSGTALQALVLAHVVANIPHEKGSGVAIKSIEDYGWGKGYRHVFDAFALVLGDLDRHAEAGRHVCIVCHAEATQAPNPQGSDWLRWEPQLQAIKNSNIRNFVLQWASHVLFLGKDVAVNPDGKAMGGTTRTLHVTEQATMLAKSRRLRDSLLVTEGDETVWEEIIK